MTSNVNEHLRDALIRHQTYLLRLSAGMRLKIQTILDKSEDEMAMRIRDKLFDKTGLATPADVKRLDSVLESIKKIRGEVWKEANASFSRN